MKRFINIYTIIGFILFINLGTLAVLRFGNPQWSKWIYICQAYYWPGGKISFPQNFSGDWKIWDKNWRIIHSQSFEKGISTNKTKIWQYSDATYRIYFYDLDRIIKTEFYENDTLTKTLTPNESGEMVETK